LSSLDVKLEVAADCIGIVVHCADQMTLLDIETFEFESLLLALDFVEDHFFQAYSFVVEQKNQ
jgi:hypothetical protein